MAKRNYVVSALREFRRASSPTIGVLCARRFLFSSSKERLHSFLSLVSKSTRNCLQHTAAVIENLERRLLAFRSACCTNILHLEQKKKARRRRCEAAKLHARAYDSLRLQSTFLPSRVVISALHLLARPLARSPRARGILGAQKAVCDQKTKRKQTPKLCSSNERHRKLSACRVANKKQNKIFTAIFVYAFKILSPKFSGLYCALAYNRARAHVCSIFVFSRRRVRKARRVMARAPVRVEARGSSIRLLERLRS